MVGMELALVRTADGLRVRKGAEDADWSKIATSGGRGGESALSTERGDWRRKEGDSETVSSLIASH